MPSTAGLESQMDQSRAHSILLIDERPLTLECTYDWLRSGSHDLAITPLQSIDVAQAELQGAAQPDLIVLSTGILRASDTHVKDGVRRLSAAAPGVPVLILSDLDEDSEIDEAREAFRLGVRGYIRSSMPPDVMIAALRLVLAGGMFIPETLLANSTGDNIAVRDVQARQRLLDLSPREMEVLIRLREGKPNKAIARELSLSVGTVQVHVRRILQKLQATSRSQVAYIISRLQFILLSQLFTT